MGTSALNNVHSLVQMYLLTACKIALHATTKIAYTLISHRRKLQNLLKTFSYI